MAITESFFPDFFKIALGRPAPLFGGAVPLSTPLLPIVSLSRTELCISCARHIELSVGGAQSPFAALHFAALGSFAVTRDAEIQTGFPL